MLETLAVAVIVIAALYLLALGFTSLVAPARAGGFLLGFAISKHLHFAELLIRLIVGAAFVLYAPRMAYSAAFSFFGWMLLVTSAALLLVPWQWHRRFAQYAVPRANRHITWIGLVALLLGSSILGAIAFGR